MSEFIVIGVYLDDCTSFVSRRIAAATAHDAFLDVCRDPETSRELELVVAVELPSGEVHCPNDMATFDLVTVSDYPLSDYPMEDA